MKKKRIIYSVHGMMEYQTIVRVGKNNVKVCFTGGSISNGCAQPARYSTDNLIMQHAIESCEDFRRGRISRERTITLNEDLIIEKNPPKPSSKIVSIIKYAKEIESADVTMPESMDGSAVTSVSNAIENEKESPRIIPDDEAEADSMKEPDAAQKPAQQDDGYNSGVKVETTEQEIIDEGDKQLEIVDASCKDVAKQYLQEHFGENPTPLRTRTDVQACAAKHGITFNFI